MGNGGKQSNMGPKRGTFMLEHTESMADAALRIWHQQRHYTPPRPHPLCTLRQQGRSRRDQHTWSNCSEDKTTAPYLRASPGHLPSAITPPSKHCRNFDSLCLRSEPRARAYCMVKLHAVVLKHWISCTIQSSYLSFTQHLGLTPGNGPGFYK